MDARIIDGLDRTGRRQLTISRMPKGGYVVSERGSECFRTEELFASSEIDDALGFIKDQLEPQPEQAIRRPNLPHDYGIVRPAPLKLDADAFMGKSPTAPHPDKPEIIPGVQG